jgi:adenylate kinase
VEIVLLGAPGSGKGTQGDRLAARLGSPRVSTGDLLREAVRAGAPLGIEAKRYMEAGELVPDALVEQLLQGRLRKEDARGGFLLDGYPRNLDQAGSLEAFLDRESRRLDHVVYLEVQEKEVLRRLTARRVCPCGAVYHLENAPPKRAGVCDACGAPLVHRTDDREDVIRQRLRVYREQTEPLLQWYEGRGLLRRVPAMGGMDEIFERVVTVLEEGGA